MLDASLHAASDIPRRAHEGINAAVRTAMRAVARTGTHVALCTGRLSTATMPFLGELDIVAGFAVCSNGAVLIDAATGRIVEQVVFSLAGTVALLRRQLPGAVFVAGSCPTCCPSTRLRMSSVGAASTHRWLI
jgi:hypothetical protein